MAGDMTRLAKAKTIVVVADDLEESHNVASVRIKDAVVREKAKLIVIGALRSELVDFCSAWIRPKGGEEGMAAAQLAEALANGAEGDDAMAQAVAILKDAPKDQTLVVCAPNPVNPAQAGAMAGGAANLAIALFGEQASTNLVVLPPEVNVHGLLDVGVAVNGASDPLEGLAGLLIVREDPTMRLAGAAEALAKIETVVVIDNVMHPTAKRASVVIAEGRAYASNGTYTQGDFRIQRLAPAIVPEGDAVECYDALQRLGTGLGLALPKTHEAALGEIAKALPPYQLAYDLIIGDGVRANVPVSTRTRTLPVGAIEAGEGIRIITGRDLYTAADAAALRHPEAEKLHRYDRIQVSEEDALRLSISSGDTVEITDGTNTISALATITDRVPEGAVFVSSLLQGGAVAQFFSGLNIPVVKLGVPVLA
jgi:predicted molibdopterin-dependent oxidoreductase YjgC